MFSTAQSLITGGLMTLICAFVGTFLASYLKRKGENLATHEDVNNLVAQMAAVTTVTKGIEAKISNEVWERQRKWDVKRDALFEAMRELASVEYALNRLILTFTTATGSAEPKSPVQRTQRGEAVELWNVALVNFKKARILALLVCDEELRESFEALETSMIAYVNGATSPDVKPAQVFATIRERINDLIQLVREELQVN